MLNRVSRKFNILYQSSLFLQANKKPEDKSPKKPVMTQSMAKCAAAYICKAKTMPLLKHHCCVICTFCLRNAGSNWTKPLKHCQQILILFSKHVPLVATSKKWSITMKFPSDCTNWIGSFDLPIPKSSWSPQQEKTARKTNGKKTGSEIQSTGIQNDGDPKKGKETTPTDPKNDDKDVKPMECNEEEDGEKGNKKGDNNSKRKVTTLMINLKQLSLSKLVE